MRLRILDWMSWLLALLCVVSFLLPWLEKAHTPQSSKKRSQELVRRLASEDEEQTWNQYVWMSPEQQDRVLSLSMDGLSGYRIPLVYGEGGSRAWQARINRSGILGKSRQADHSWFVYAFPVLAIFAATFVSFVRKRWALWIPILTCFGLYFTGRFIMIATYYDRMSAHVHLGFGFWASLYCILLLGIVSIFRMLFPRSKVF